MKYLVLLVFLYGCSSSSKMHTMTCVGVCVTTDVDRKSEGSSDKLQQQEATVAPK